MMLPYANGVQSREMQGNAFRGYRREPFGSLSAFWDMQNMTGADAPLIRTRDKRYRVCEITKCNGIFGGDKVGWCDRNTLVYDGKMVGLLKEDSPKTFVRMGAMVLIFPDKMIYNTHTNALTDMEHTVEAAVAHAPCDMLGEDVPADEAVYVRLQGADIGKGFKGKDVVVFSGAFAWLNGAKQIERVLSDDKIVVMAVEDKADEGLSGVVKIERTTPDMDYVTECDNRIWGCSSKNHEIYACKLGDPTNWQSYQGLADDAYAVTVGSEGDFTGAMTHMGYVYFFKENMHHKVFGNKPSNYQVQSSHVRGVEKGSEKSLCILNETMYYHSPDGMCASNGALPQKADEALGNVRYHNVKCGAVRGRLWAAMTDEAGNNHLFTMDDDTMQWHREDDTAVTAFAAAGNNLYMLKGVTELWCLTGEGDTTLRDGGARWEETPGYMVETGDLDLANLYRKRLQKIHLRMTLNAEATARVLVQYDGGAWNSVWTAPGGKNLTSIMLPFVPRRCDRMRIRIEGTGMMRLYNLNAITQGGTEIG